MLDDDCGTIKNLVFFLMEVIFTEMFLLLLISEPKKPSVLCTICNKTFNGASALRIHQLSHVTEKSFECKADGCGKVFPNSSALR